MLQNIMKNIVTILVASLLFVGCARSHELPVQDSEDGEPECVVEWVCYEGLTPEGDPCDLPNIGIDPCHSAPDFPEGDCPGTWERMGGAWNYTPGEC